MGDRQLTGDTGSQLTVSFPPASLINVFSESLLCAGQLASRAVLW